MIPLRDNIPSRTFPLVNYVVIGICSLAFFAQLTQPQKGRIAEAYGMIPARVSGDDRPIVVPQRTLVRTPRGIQVREQPRVLAPAATAPILTFITCMFLHGGWMHFLGNMWFLYIFGDNVEDRLGHIGYVLLYLATGVLAGLSHYVVDPSSPVPTIGASGAIAGVMGAYAWFYPHAKVQALLPIIIIFTTFVLPAPIFLGIWFLIQTFSGVQSLGGETTVAWWAHIGGFVAGAAAAYTIGRTPLDHGEVHTRRF